ncbi:hypothetical protein CWI83_05575 [Pseudidiomarina taiwanensis]|uniref:Tail specific protease domain-containing protein n=1 Tax=Pseudidiomarina taiwanensis TaxID=337250 RepID=A0A432ZKE8_9GAMM|nr:hypothetical protein CWI83_05575 [Pseudidiomarina taiwanensis]
MTSLKTQLKYGLSKVSWRLKQRCKYFTIVTCSLWLVACSSSTPLLQLTDGVYWSDRYQSYLVVADGLISRYQWTPPSCQMAAAGLLPKVFSQDQLRSQHRWLAADTQFLVLQRESDGLPVVFRRESFLPSNCGVQTVASAEINVETLAATFSQFNQPLSPSDLLQWRYLAERLDTEFAQADLATNLALFELLTEMLKGSGDRHAFIFAPELESYQQVGDFSQDEAERAQAQAVFAQVLEESELQSRCEKNLWFGALNREQYYLGLTSLQGFTADAPYGEAGQRCLQRALSAVARDLENHQQTQQVRPELIVDLRFNAGGSLLLASQFANSLAPSPRPLSIINRHAVQEQRSPDLSGLYQGGRVLVSEITASAAEHLAHGMRIRGFRLEGQRTRGAFSPTTVRTLPNGWIVGLSMYPTSDVRDGWNQAYPEGRGLIPDRQIPLQLLLPTELAGVLAQWQSNPAPLAQAHPMGYFHCAAPRDGIRANQIRFLAFAQLPPANHG